jgi:hypothetical protein
MKVVHLNPRMNSPWKRPNSANYWFRLAIPPRYRAAVGQSEIKLSLETTDIREARRLCGLMQCEWLAKFQALDVVAKVADEHEGAEVVDRFIVQGGDKAGHRNAGAVLSVAD